MKKFICVLLIVGTMFALSACTVTLPLSATSNTLGSKTGTTSIIIGDGVFGGDLSIATAAKNGKITKISTVDFMISLFEKNNLFSFSTIVTGE